MSRKLARRPFRVDAIRTALQPVPEPVEIPRDRLPTWARADLLKMEPGTRVFYVGECSVFLSHSRYGWHFSISHPKRYPTWDEVAKVRYTLLPNNVTMAMMLPPREQYVNYDDHCFQCWQVVEPTAGYYTILAQPDELEVAP